MSSREKPRMVRLREANQLIIPASPCKIASPFMPPRVARKHKYLVVKFCFGGRLMSITITLESNPFIDILYAIDYINKQHRIEGAYEKNEMNELIDYVFLPCEQEKILRMIKELGINKLVEFISCPSQSNIFTTKERFEEIEILIKKLKTGMNEWKKSKYDIYTNCKSICEKLQFWVNENKYLDELKEIIIGKENISKNITITIIPCFFMLPAPEGKMVCLNSFEEIIDIQIFFGFRCDLLNNQYHFIGWLNSGICHVLTDLMLDQFRKSKFDEFKEFPFHANLMIYFDKNILFHRDYWLYLREHIISANKIVINVSTIDKQTYKSIAIAIAEPLAKGLFHIEWFVNKMLTLRPITTIKIEELLEDWNNSTDDTKNKLPIFPERLEACSYDLWKQRSRVFFSPSISLKTRRLLKLLNTSTQKSPAVHDEELFDENWNNYCNNVYIQEGDVKWIESLRHEHTFLDRKSVV